MRLSLGKEFSFNLRQPGQYFDAETGLSYNYFRDYDPAVGAYVESDSVGQKGGPSTYAYAAGAPSDFADPYGLMSITQMVLNLLSKTGDCKDSERQVCSARCAPRRVAGCYVTISWKLKGIRGGEPIRSEQRKVNCNCEDPEECVPGPAPKKGKGARSSDTLPVLPPWWVWDFAIP